MTKTIKKEIKRLNKTLPNYNDIIKILESKMTKDETKKVLQSLYEQGMISYWHTNDKKFNKDNFYHVVEILKNYKDADSICQKHFLKNFNKKDKSEHYPIVPLRKDKRRLPKNERLAFDVAVKLLRRAF